MSTVVVVGLGGFVGAIARYGLTALVPHRPGELFPLGTLLVNGLGSFLMGLAMGWLGRHPEIGGELRLMVTAGLLASFTTFSTLVWECVALAQSGRIGGAAACLAANLGLGLAALLIGLALRWG